MRRCSRSARPSTASGWRLGLSLGPRKLSPDPRSRYNHDLGALVHLDGLAYPKTRGPGYSHGSMSIEAAIRGEGVALGRSVLVAEDLAEGRLVAPFPKASLEVEWGYDLVYRTGNEHDLKVDAFRNWIIEEIREFVTAHTQL